MRIITSFSFILLFFACQNDVSKNYTQINPGEELVSINGTELFCKVMGVGEPIVIIHGGPGLNHQYFLPHLETLAEDYTLVFYDQRASGRSSADLDSSGISLDLFLSDIEEIRKHFKIEKMNLLGHSWGGLLAMNYALKYPNSLNNLILSSSTPASSELRARESSKISERITREDRSERATIITSESFKAKNAQAYEQFFKWMFKKEFKNEALVSQLNLNFQMDYVENNKLLQNLAKDIGQYDFHEDLKKINTRTLVIYGDYETAVEAGKTIHEHLPNSEFVLLKDCGHFPFIEQPDGYSKAIEDFLD